MQNSFSPNLTLRLTTLDTSTGLARQWCVRGPRHVTWSEVAASVSLPTTAYVGSIRVLPDSQLGEPPLVNHAIVRAAPEPARPPHLLELVADEGPCVGAKTPVTEHCTTVGRSRSNHFYLQDLDLSRRHCEVQIEQGRAVVCDADSTNGTTIDGVSVGATFVELRMDQRLRVGGSTLALRKPAKVPSDDRTDECGRYLIYRSPRVAPQLDDVVLLEPSPAEVAVRRRFPWVAATIPLVLAAVMVAVLRNPIFAAFALLSPVMVVAQYVGDRGSSRGRHRAAADARRQEVAAFERACANALLMEQATRRRMDPPITRATHDVSFRTSAVWQRAPGHRDHLRVRLGIGTVASNVKVRSGTDPPQAVPVDEVPVTLSFVDHRVVGFSGTHRFALALGVLTQLCVWHSPSEVQVLVICADPASRATWSVVDVLPHLLAHPAAAPRVVVAHGDGDEFLAWCSQLATAVDPGPPHTLLILDGAVTEIAAVSDLVENAARYGLTVLALHDVRARLPPECTTAVQIDRSDRAGMDNLTFRPDLITTQAAATAARSLAALADADPSIALLQIPDRVSHADLVRSELALDLADTDAVRRLWSSSEVDLRALIGDGAQGPVWVDLASDGPHALVAGTTGSGKSELLQTLIASLALANPPSQLTFVLVDYKGGAAFQDCARLPHTLGLVTDLDAHLTTRALCSLEAEVHRRERLLASAGASDITQFDRSHHPTPLARLCIVVDEFRVLSQELPEFIDGLVRIAAVGRSLGIHLILATQRPAGVVSADMRANINLRIALRVRDVSDSHDVIETDAAASISAALPGRAIMRTGGGKPCLLQTAYTGTPPTRGDVPVEVARIDPISGSPLWTLGPAVDGPRSGLQVLVDTVSVVAQDCSKPPPRSPWLAPLPSLLHYAKIDPTRGRDLALGQATQSTIFFGQVDLPDRQEQVAIGWNPPIDGHLALVGGPRSGRTTAARSIAQSAANHWTSDRLHLYVMDGSGNLSELGGLPHCGAVVLRDELTRALRLVDRLTATIADRQLRYGASGFPPDVQGLLRSDDARVLLVVDGWEIFQEVSNEQAVGELEDRLGQVLRDGGAVGVSVVATGGRALLSGRVSAHFSSTVALRMTDPADLLMAGLRSTQIPSAMPPGRGLVLPGGQEVQFALPGEAARTCCSTTTPGCDDPTGTANPPATIGALPGTVSLAELPAAEPNSLFVGAGTDAPAALPLGDRGDAGWLVCGPPRSGRSTALASLARSLCAGRPVAWISPGTPQVRLPATITRLSHDDPTAVSGWCGQYRNGAVLIDDLDQLTGMLAENCLLEHLARSRSTGAIICASGTAPDLGNTFRGLAPELRRRQTGILLQPARHDGDVFGVRIGPTDRPHPGRGLLVVRGNLTPLQVATP